MAWEIAKGILIAAFIIAMVVGFFQTLDEDPDFLVLMLKGIAFLAGTFVILPLALYLIFLLLTGNKAVYQWIDSRLDPMYGWLNSIGWIHSTGVFLEAVISYLGFVLGVLVLLSPIYISLKQEKRWQKLMGIGSYFAVWLFFLLYAIFVIN